MKVEEIKKLLASAGLRIKTARRLGNNTGLQLRLFNGGIVNCFDNGNHNVQGKNKDAVKKALAGKDLTTSPTVAISMPVIVVYGHDQTGRTELEAKLRSKGLEPIVMNPGNAVEMEKMINSHELWIVGDTPRLKTSIPKAA